MLCQRKLRILHLKKEIDFSKRIVQKSFSHDKRTKALELRKRNMFYVYKLFVYEFLCN